MPNTREAGLVVPVTAQQFSPHSPGDAVAGAAPAVNEEHLVSALHAAFAAEHPDATAPAPPLPTAREKTHTSLDITVANDQLVLRGTGVDVEPTLLTGNVVLHLTEPTSIKQILLVFRGKARVPSNPTDPHVLNSSPNQYIVCSHDWTFLEGEKKYSHTLKAGRHLFPFELRLGGSLPSSIATYVNGGASISYKLRATAVRPGLAANLTAVLPITLLRSFAPESLEYQQTLEIENTWPEKVMYALMIPHKAWAAGDEVSALVKFAPLAKGVHIVTITTNLSETTKTLARGGHLEKTRNILTKKHEIVRGKAVSVDEQQRKRLARVLHNTLGEQGHQQQVGMSLPSGSSSPVYPASGASAFVSGTSTPAIDGLALSRADTHHSSTSGSSLSSDEERSRDAESDTEVTTVIGLKLPTSLTPSHSLDPIVVSYRIRWSVLLGNLDGHTSELRCSLPIHILDHSLLEEARNATSATRRMLFGGEDAPHDAGEEDAQLPSYPSHVRDRVAVESTPVSPEALALRPYALEGPDSALATPARETAPRLSNFPGFSLPHSHPPSALPSSYSTHDAGGFPFAFNTPGAPNRASAGTSASVTPPDSTSADSSRPGSRHERERDSGGWGPFSLSRRPSRSRINSRANSRAPSPERERERGDGRGHSGPGGTPSPSVARADETHVHAANAASRQSHGLFSVVMKPMTNLSSFSAPWHAHAHSQALAQHFQTPRSSISTGSPSDQRGLTMPLPSPFLPMSTPGLYTPTGEGGGTLTSSASTSAVPDYFTAARNGSSGMPPLETLRGLPTYEDSEAQTRVSGPGSPQEARSPGSDGSGAPGHRSFSDTDLVSHFARARASGGTPAASQLQQRLR